MLAIFKREVQSFFTSPIGYLIIGLFLLINGLFLWVFKGDYNIFDYGFADLGNFFLLAPWIFVFLIPAITMKSFSEEQKMGTLELLLIKPISVSNLVLGKFLGGFLLCVLTILPTLVYIFAISKLGITEGNFDSGVVIGSYFGLLFLIAMYTAVGVFSSTLSTNQIIAFILGILICFILYYGFDAVGSLFSQGTVQDTIKSLSAKTHSDSIARGVLEVKDFIYFISITLFFLYLTLKKLKP